MSDDKSLEEIEREIDEANGTQAGLVRALSNMTDLLKGLMPGKKDEDEGEDDPDEDESASDMEDDDEEDMGKGSALEVYLDDSFYDSLRSEVASTVHQALNDTGVTALSKGLIPVFEANGEGLKSLEARLSALEATISGMAKGFGASPAPAAPVERTATDKVGDKVSAEGTAARTATEATTMAKGNGISAPLGRNEAVAALNAGLINSGDYARWQSEGLQPGECAAVRARLKTQSTPA